MSPQKYVTRNTPLKCGHNSSISRYPRGLGLHLSSATGGSRSWCKKPCFSNNLPQQQVSSSLRWLTESCCRHPEMLSRPLHRVFLFCLIYIYIFLIIIPTTLNIVIYKNAERPFELCSAFSRHGIVGQRFPAYLGVHEDAIMFYFSAALN